ncbi:CPBP family glutamic-type intramembrane protease [Streptococcus ferus]|uniref:CPBP family glutamic-type intramembrane protease n=1 Tax=Streptococcus ferus TaxID=1345 RepID=UPI0035A1394B
MNIKLIRSDKVYRELLEMPMAERKVFTQGLITFLVSFVPTDLQGYQLRAQESKGLYIFLTIIISPLFEEMLFRGLLFNGLKKVTPLGFSFCKLCCLVPYMGH